MSTEKNINKALEDHILGLVDVEIPETLIDEQTKTKFAGMMSGESSVEEERSCLRACCVHWPCKFCEDVACDSVMRACVAFVER